MATIKINSQTFERPIVGKTYYSALGPAVVVKVDRGDVYYRRYGGACSMCMIEKFWDYFRETQISA